MSVNGTAAVVDVFGDVPVSTMESVGVPIVTGSAMDILSPDLESTAPALKGQG